MTEEQRKAHIQQQISTLRRRKARKAVEKKILDQHEDMNIIMKNFLKKSKSSNSMPSRRTTFKSSGQLKHFFVNIIYYIKIYLMRKSLF